MRIIKVCDRMGTSARLIFQNRFRCGGMREENAGWYTKVTGVSRNGRVRKQPKTISHVPKQRTYEPRSDRQRSAAEHHRPGPSARSRARLTARHGSAVYRPRTPEFKSKGLHASQRKGLICGATGHLRQKVIRFH